jgi:acetyl/propionyl-CoA carboxylase alpha subunit
MTKPLSKLLIANRGEVAIRIARAAEELGITTLAVYAEDDADGLHVQKSDARQALTGKGARAYLDAAQLVRVAVEAGCDAVHPGYGFLSESAPFAERCAAAGLTFVGPRPRQLALLGDKLQARVLAEGLGVPVAKGSVLLESEDDARRFFATLAGRPALLKAAFGGGGRGMRVVEREADLAAAFARCRSEAEAAFGNGALYMEELFVRPRHIEVQVLGDGSGAVAHLGERECSLQRRHQKLIEVAPSPRLDAALRERLCTAAVRMASEVGYLGLGTFEFLLSEGGERFVFMEANPRLQVEHTVTEEVLGIDLVKAQLRIAQGASLSELGLTQAEIPSPRGFAIQLRVNAERVAKDGSVLPASGRVRAYELPAGPGVRVEHAVYTGYAPGPSFDSLLLKLIVHASSAEFAGAVLKARRALAELRVDGVDTNLELLQATVGDEAFARFAVYTTFLEEQAPRLLGAGPQRRLSFATPASADDAPPEEPVPSGLSGVVAPLQGRLVSVDVTLGALVRAGQQLCVIEAMKMESAVTASASGVVRELRVGKGDNVAEGQVLVCLEPSEHGATAAADLAEEDAAMLRRDLAEVLERKAKLTDERRPEAVHKRHKLGQRTARENLADLCDPGSFFEYGGLAIAAQRSTRPIDTLIDTSPCSAPRRRAAW